MPAKPPAKPASGSPVAAAPSPRKDLPRPFHWRWWGGGFLSLRLWSSYSREADSFLPSSSCGCPQDHHEGAGPQRRRDRRLRRGAPGRHPLRRHPQAFVGARGGYGGADFWSHDGSEGRGLLRAGFTRSPPSASAREGASTLTMQLVRTVTAKRQKQLNRKLKEIVLARKLEKAYKKKQIFGAYANEVYFGGGR
ncbi:MAG: transglycosylase domain-containing protein [Holophagaceae bacterium]|nr:transglycosylase domain-containing protein [Holophagaceae bacterium]